MLQNEKHALFHPKRSVPINTHKPNIAPFGEADGCITAYLTYRSWRLPYRITVTRSQGISPYSAYAKIFLACETSHSFYLI